MVNAFILLIAEAGKEESIINQLLESEFVKEAHIVYGQYDIIVKVNLERVTQLNEFLIKVIRPIAGVRDSSTMISAHD